MNLRRLMNLAIVTIFANLPKFTKFTNLPKHTPISPTTQFLVRSTPYHKKLIFVRAVQMWCITKEITQG